MLDGYSLKCWSERGLLGLGVLACLVIDGRSDTIYLKNGRIIRADQAEIQGEKVVYTTSDGRVTLPMSMVEQVVKDGPVREARFRRADAAGPSSAKPVAERTVAPATRHGKSIAAPGAHPVAEDFSLPDESRNQFSLSRLRGRPVLLDFWATWCGPCRESMPVLQKLHEKYGPRGLTVLGVNIEGPDAAVTQYVRDGGYTFKVVFDSGNFAAKVARQYKVNSIPRTFLIDKTGQIRYSGHPVKLSPALIEAVLDE